MEITKKNINISKEKALRWVEDGIKYKVSSYANDELMTEKVYVADRVRSLIKSAFDLYDIGELLELYIEIDNELLTIYYSFVWSKSENEHRIEIKKEV